MSSLCYPQKCSALSVQPFGQLQLIYIYSNAQVAHSYYRSLPALGRKLRLNLQSQNRAYNVPVTLPSSPTKIWWKSVQGFMSYDRTKKSNRPTNRDYKFIFMYIYRWEKIIFRCTELENLWTILHLVDLTLNLERGKSLINWLISWLSWIDQLTLIVVMDWLIELINCQNVAERGYVCNFKWLCMQRWQCPIYNSTIKSFVWLSMNYVFF